ncbi:lysosomal-trafficking regulator isoform X1 [Drosophila tropicalis]|uniref:lysosomal-trafficking regulator isoform X1 n=1 Tax=Drosophila tropicalis TaxID=46794 RepID=UPI0035AC2815
MAAAATPAPEEEETKKKKKEEHQQQHQQKHHEQQLLVDTLSRLWSHYLQASEHNDEASVKEHWLWLLLYNFQFVDEESLPDIWSNSHFNLMPEELCSYLLEQVYQIISAAKRSQTNSPEHQDETVEENKCIKQLRKQHNLAQLILSTPSDCNKILALRTYLTNNLGHHLLAFLLRVDIKHIASQMSLCQLCINLFPNSKWSPSNDPLQPLTSVSQFIANFNITQKRTKQRRHQQPQQHHQGHQQPTQSSQLLQNISGNIEEILYDFDEFKSSSKSSDELALLLIQLLTRCIDAEHESQLSVTVHNFALGHLCASSGESDQQQEDNEANDEIIKFELLQLIGHCVNNFYAHDQQPNVDDFNSNFGQLLYAMAANRHSPILAHSVLYIMFGTLHNLVENEIRELNQIDANNFDPCFEVLEEAAKSTDASTLIFLQIYKLLLRLTDNLSRQEQQLQCLMESSTSSALPKQQLRHKRQRHSQLHCTGSSLSCYFQGKLYQLLPLLGSELQEHSVRCLLRTGSCCCHYNTKNYNSCLQLAINLSKTYQKYAYKFLHYNFLNTIFVKRSPLECPRCEEKVKSAVFHLDLLAIYKENYKKLLNSTSMLLFLKHLKHIAYLLSYDLASGILAEVVLPIFRQYKEMVECKSEINRHNKVPLLQLPSKLENYRALHECLSIFVMYLSDIRLVKAFYNEENIRYMQDLLAIPELQRGVCDLIKVGIDNIAFLGENGQEQIALSRRLIQLQLNSSDRATQLFQLLLQKCSKCSQNKFWLDDIPDPMQLDGHKPSDILYITALQWTLNYDLLKTSQLFYNEFAKIYSIPVEMSDHEDDDDNEDKEQSPQQQQQQQLEQGEKLKQGDKTIIDILKLNYNALSCFLMLPKAANGMGTTSTAAVPTATETQSQTEVFTIHPPIAEHIVGISGSSSLEAIVSHVQSPFNALSVSTTTAASSNYGDSLMPFDYATVIDNYTADVTAPSFLQHLQHQSNDLDESIILFDIRGVGGGGRNTQNNDNPSTATTVDEATAAANGLIHRLFNIVGSLFGSSTNVSASGSPTTTPTISQPAVNIDADLFCLYEPNGECKKLLLKLFESTMAICIKGFQNEEVEKMQKHLRKLKAIILGHASSNWQEHGEQHARDNAVIQTLQTLLKIAELSSTHNEPAGVVVSSPSAESTNNPQPRPRARSFNSGSVELPRQMQPVKLPAKNSMATPPTPRRRPASSEINVGDADYFSTRASLSCAADSELELSENEQEFYLTADEGYEADGEIAELTESECELNGGAGGGGPGGAGGGTGGTAGGGAANESWTPFQPSSRYRTHIMHQGLSQLVVQMLVELSLLCIKQPNGWTESLTQLANRLFVIRDYLGGPLCLLRGFAPILSCSDPRLRELQQSILELITHLNTPDVLHCYYSILASKQPPVDLLMRHMHHISAVSLRKCQPCMELEFPITIDGKVVITSKGRDHPELIERVRLQHQQSQANTLFTRAACIMPVTQTRLWQADGLTLSLWLEIRGGQQMHRSCMQLNDDETRYSGEDLTKSHLVSLGTNQAMLSIYISNNMQLVFEMVKPNEPLPPIRVEEHIDSTVDTSSFLPLPVAGSNPVPAPAVQSGSLRQALKQTKMALLNSFGQMHLLNGHYVGHHHQDSCSGYFVSSAVVLQRLRLPRHKWMNLVFGLQQQADSLEVSIYVDGLEQHTMCLPFQNLRHVTKAHDYQMLALGEGLPSSSSSSSRSTLDGCLAPRYALSNLILFRRRLIEPSLMINLTAMGPDFTEFTQCQVANWKPNYGYVNLAKLSSSNFGNHSECMKQLRHARVLVYTAQQPELVMSYDVSQELDMACYGQPHGHILYGELLQNQPQSLQTATSLCGGLSTLLYLFARIVELSGNAGTQALALDLLLQVAHSDAQLYTEFQRQDYLALIGYVVKSEKCSKDVQLLRSIVNTSCSQALISRKGDALQVNDNTTVTLIYPRLLLAVLQRYSDWHRSGSMHSDVLDMLFRCILALTRDKHPQRDFNMEQLQKSGLLSSLLNLCKVYVIESPSPVHISPYAAECFVQILSVFAGSPPSSSLLDEIMKLLLLLHKPSECYVTHDRGHFYFLLTPQQPIKERSLVATNLSRVTTSFRRQIQAAPPPEIDTERAERIKRLRRMHAGQGSGYKRAVNELEEQLEQTTDCSNLNKPALRLISPVEASRWRLKFKRHYPAIAQSPKRSPLKMTDSSNLNRQTSNTSSNSWQMKFKRLYPTSSNQSSKLSPLKSVRRRLIQNHFHAGKIWQPSGHSTPSSGQMSALPNRKTDFYDQMGIQRLQQRLLILLKDFLCLLPDSAVDEVLRHFVKLEFLLVLANQRSCAVRQAIIQLLAVLTKRLASGELTAATKQLYPIHLANQMCVHPCDINMFEACLTWISGIHASLDDILTSKETLKIRQRFGLQSLMAIAMTTEPQKIFKALLRLYLQNPEDQVGLIEAGLLQCSVKALFNIYTLRLGQPNQDESIVELLGGIGDRALRSVGHINLVWDILNLLSFYQSKQSPSIVRSFRSVQALLQLQWLNIFFEAGSFRTIAPLPNCTLSSTEIKTRLELLIDRCTQFFTVGSGQSSTGPSYVAGAAELSLFQTLVSYCMIYSNQRCSNFIAWGLQPSRPFDLRSYIVDSLWKSQQDDFHRSGIVCDGKMIKALLWLSLQENERIDNLVELCTNLGIKEDDTSWNLLNELERLDQNRSNAATKQKTLLEKTVYKYEPLVQHCIETSMVTTRRVAELQNSERKALMSHMKDYDDTYTYTKWLEIIRRMSHEGAPWYCAERTECSWELDDTEGPSRVHTRLRRCHLDIDRRFFMNDYCPGQGQRDDLEPYVRPLDYLIASYDQQLNISLNSQILYNFAAKFLPVDGEIEGEIIITDLKLYFLATYRCRYFNVNCDIANITEIWLKRYQHQETAFEILLDTNKSLFFSLQNADDWKIMRDVFCDKIVSTPDQAKILGITQQWREGLLTNWEYLMTLNQIAGRTYNDLMQYPVFPWVLANYYSECLDLRDSSNFRKLGRPIAVQLEENEKHYVSNYAYIDSANTTMGSLILKPYHYSSHYSNSGTVLHFLVRVPPFTSYFLRYQDNDFDLPDRTFHALNTTWLLASRDSPTDVKELIPEFFCLPEMFENFERFNFGCRQNGERVEDVSLPPWCHRDSRLFVLIHRQALESEMVRNHLHHWIDLIYGYKQSGESAIEAINVFHPATYAVFLDSEISDPIEREAVKTMVKTYGQMPRQLFKSAHPATKALDYSLVDKSIVSTVKGLRWGVYVGSPQLKVPTLGNIHKIPGTEHLVSFSNTNVVYALPGRASVMQGAEPDTYNVISWGYDDHIVRIQPLNKPQAKPKNLLHNGSFDDISACGCDVNSNQLWFGHKSGRISVYKCAGGVDSQQRSGTKSRQSYVRGLRLSYNSAFRKIATKSMGGGGGGGVGAGGNGLEASDDISSIHATHSASSVSSASNSSTLDALQRDGADLSWLGPTFLVRHTDEITCIALSVEFKIAVSAGRDGIAVIWDLNDWSYVRTIARPAEIHQSPITHVAISPTLGDIVTVHTLPQQTPNNPPTSPTNVDAIASKTTPITTTTTLTHADECFEVTEENLDDFVNVNINPNGKSILRLHSVNARYVQHLVHEDRILAVCYSYIKEGVGVNVIATAVEGGCVRFWSSWNLSFVSELVTGISPIRSICFSTHQHLVVLTRESYIQVWESEGLYGNAPKFPQIVYK